MNVAMTGASGFIAGHLTPLLTSRGHTVHPVSRKADASMIAQILRDADAVIHLAGEPVAQRWSDEVKHRIRHSRVDGTRHLVRAIAALDRRPRVLVSASAVGFYGDRGDDLLDESSPAGAGFLPEVCIAWESQAAAARDLGLRVAMIRTGLALHPGGGALKKMLPPFRLGVGGRLGDGHQWAPWIHIDDLAALFAHALETPVEGPLNGAAPNPVTNAEFTRALAHALHRPAMFPAPRFALRLLLGEMSGLLFDSQRVLPHAAEASGFRFRFPSLNAALESLFR
jgi:uncharacterized protein (TIGR01777 family)